MADHKEAKESLDTSILREILYKAQLLKEIDAPLSIHQYTNGYSNLTYLISTENREWVLRKPPAGAIKKGHDMGREYKVLSQLSPHFDKAPKPFYYEYDPQLIGAPFYLMEKKEGVVINYKEALERQLTETDFKMIAETWLDSFVEFHDIDYREVGLSDLGRPEGYVERQIATWSKQYLKAATQELPDATFVMNWLSENQPASYEHTLIHNDFKYDNTVFAEGDWSRITAILDWEMCTLGDPLMDLGTSLGYWTMKSDGPTFMQTLPSPTALKGNPTRSEIVEMYASKSGRQVDKLIFYYVYGLFKIAVIVQQIFYRYNKGLTTNPKFSQLDKVCAFLCLTAKQAITKKGIENLF